MSESITNNTERKRFEISMDGATAFVEYMTNVQGNMFLTHTEVPKQLGGRGLGSKLVKHALKHIEAEGFKLVPLCPFVASYLRKHPDWKRILADGYNV